MKMMSMQLFAEQMQAKAEFENYIISLRVLTGLNEKDIKLQVAGLSKSQCELLKNALAADDFETAKNHGKLSAVLSESPAITNAVASQYEYEAAKVKERFDALKKLSVAPLTS